MCVCVGRGVGGVEVRSFSTASVTDISSLGASEQLLSRLVRRSESTVEGE